MYEKAPANIHISYPLCNGVIADIKNMQTLVKCFITDLCEGVVKPADYYIAVPTDVTEVEKRAFYDLVKNANVKAKKVMVVEKAIADGLGLGIDVKNSQGVLVVDVGYDTTEISILSLGGIVLSKLIKTGGFKFDDAIRAAVRREYNLLIGYKSAEKLKISLHELKQKKEKAVVYGRDIVSGLPMEREISTDLIDECLREHFKSIIDNVKINLGNLTEIEDMINVFGGALLFFDDALSKAENLDNKLTIDYVNKFSNLYCVGRNGQHRYNNMDHSMLTGIECVKNIVNSSEERLNIWNINTEKEYHEIKENKDD